MKVNIIGGGIIGWSTAYYIGSQADVTVYEKDPSYSLSSFARSCGGLRSQYFTETNIEMSRWSIDFIKNQTDVDFTPNGYLMLFGNDQKDDHDHSLELQTKHGATTISMAPNILSPYYPYLNIDDLYRGCVTRDGSEGWIDPVTLHSWFKKNAQLSGVKLIVADGTTVDHGDADAIIICSGCWSGEVGKHFGLDIPVKGHKHTVFNVNTQAEHIPTMPLIADLITGIYIRPEGNGYIVGYDGNGEWETDDLEPNYESWEKVWELLYHRFPTIFDAAKMTGAWSGYYDSSTIDNNAIIDQDGKIFFATGFTGRGLMHSPAVGLTMSELVLGKSTTFDIEGYQLNRIPNIEKYVI